MLMVSPICHGLVNISDAKVAKFENHGFRVYTEKPEEQKKPAKKAKKVQ